MPPTPLVGRDGDLEQLCAGRRHPEARLVTLTGTGGAGKRGSLSLALHRWARPPARGVIPLAAVRDAEVMWKTIADLLDAGGDRPAADVVTEHLSTRRVLPVLDNP